MSSLTRVDSSPSLGNLERWRSFDPLLLFATVALCGFGIFAVYVAGTDDRQAYATDQTIGFVFGMALAIPLALIDYRVWKQRMWAIYGVAIVLLLLVLVAGVTVNGAESWFRFGPIQFQPSELAKLCMVIVLSAYLADRTIADNGVLLRAIGILAVPGLLVLAQPDLGTALVFGALFIAIVFIAGARTSQLAVMGLALLAAIFVVLRFDFLKQYQKDRLTAFLNQENSEIGYQVWQSKVAIGSGGLTGKGIDTTTLANLGFLPEDQTDFIFANLTERIGFVGGLALLLLFLILIWRILHIATISRDRFGILISVGIGAIFLFHVLVNVGMTMGIMPVTGIPLPFISYGRSSLVVSLLCLGLLQSIAIRSRSDMAKHAQM